MAPNPEAIAWYLKRSEDLLDDLRDQIGSLRTRGGQLAGFSGAILALAGANAVSVLDALGGASGTTRRSRSRLVSSCSSLPW
jgi:hypothetical protein